MNLGRTVFSQLISFLPDREFRRCVSRYDGDRRWRGFSCWDQFLCMAFAQLTYRESLRDIEACLRSLGAKLYHMGFRSQVARSTLADANESRDWRIYADFAQVLIRIARPLYARDPIGVDLDQSLYALDSTTIDLCLSLFPWAKFRRLKVSKKDQTALKKLLGGGVEQVRVTLRAVALQRLGEGMSAPQIAAVLTRQSVRNLARRYQQGGLERALYDKQRPGAASLLSAQQRQRIIAMVCSDPPKGRARWTVRLVAEEAVKRRLVPRAGRETIRVLLLSHDLKPWREKNVVRGRAQ